MGLLIQLSILIRLLFVFSSYDNLLDNFSANISKNRPEDNSAIHLRQTCHNGKNKTSSTSVARAMSCFGNGKGLREKSLEKGEAGEKFPGETLTDTLTRSRSVHAAFVSYGGGRYC